MNTRTPNQIALKKFFKNPVAVLSLGIILLLVIVSLFAYHIAPDYTPDANEQFSKLTEKKPGFKITMLRLKKDTEVSRSFIRKMLYGSERAYTLVPIDSLVYKSPETAMVYPYKGAPYTIHKDALAFKNNKTTTTVRFVLGTDQLGRDILSRLLIGSRVSLLVGFFAVIISSFIGILVGGIAGYYRSWIDKIILWKMSVFWSIPTILLAMAMFVGLKSYFSSNLWLVFIAIGITMWVSMARIVRGQVMAYKNIQFVEAGKMLAYSDFRIIFKHILPNLIGPIVVIMASNFANAILVESGLSFLGLGVQAPTPSWGSMLSEFKNFIGTDLSYLALLPGLLIMLLVLSFNLVGNGLRDALDIKN